MLASCRRCPVHWRASQPVHRSTRPITDANHPSCQKKPAPFVQHAKCALIDAASRAEQPQRSAPALADAMGALALHLFIQDVPLIQRATMFSGPLLATRRAREEAELLEAAEACAARAAQLRGGPGSQPVAVQGSTLFPGTPCRRDESPIDPVAAAAEAPPQPWRLAEVCPAGPLTAVSLGPETSLTDTPLLEELLPLLSESPGSGPCARRRGTAGMQRAAALLPLLRPLPPMLLQCPLPAPKCTVLQYPNSEC